MQASQGVISNVIQTIVTAQQPTATQDQRRQAIELSEQASACFPALHSDVLMHNRLCHTRDKHGSEMHA